MKHLKYFENTNWNKMYDVKPQKWVISLKMPDFIISLKKIGVTDIERWTNLYRNKVFTDYGKYPDREVITMNKEKYKSDDNRTKYSFTWSYYPVTKDDENEYFKFMGKLECTPEEIKQYNDEMEMERQSNKYNI
jgi:hypothetical protein